MKLFIYAFTEKGRELAEKLKELPNHEVYISKSENLSEDFNKADGLIFISALGISVRLIAPFIKSKKTDPAVVVIDDTGRFTISLLSGHLGGANSLTIEISDFLENSPVITTASDNRNIEALDVFAKDNGLFIYDFEKMKSVMTDIVNGKIVGFFSEIREKPEGFNFLLSDDFNSRTVSSWVIISSSIIETEKKSCILIPKNLNIGIGCKKNTAYEKIKTALICACKEAGVYEQGISKISTITLKKDEAGIIELSEVLGAEFKIFTADEINSVEAKEKSYFVHKTAGVYAVSEPCAVLSGGEIILRKFHRDGVTISISKEKFIK